MIHESAFQNYFVPQLIKINFCLKKCSKEGWKLNNNYTERIKPTMYCYKYQFLCKSSTTPQDWVYTVNGMERWLIQNQLRSDSSTHNMLKLTNADSTSVVTVAVTRTKKFSCIPTVIWNWSCALPEYYIIIQQHTRKFLSPLQFTEIET